MRHVFISYAREDQAKARIIADGLERVGIHVWWDDRLQLGQSFEPEIINALNNALAVLVLWSRSSVRSEWVYKEASLAQANSVLLPIRLDDALPPGEFAALDCANLQTWRPGKPHGEFDQIIRTLKSLTGSPGTGDWSAERIARDTLLVRLDREQHTVQYTKGKVHVDGQPVTEYGNAVSAERNFNFDLSDGPQRYMCRLDVLVTAFRGDVKRMTLAIGANVIYDG